MPEGFRALEAAAARYGFAIETVLAAPARRTPDLKGSADTVSAGKPIVAEIG